MRKIVVVALGVVLMAALGVFAAVALAESGGGTTTTTSPCDIAHPCQNPGCEQAGFGTDDCFDTTQATVTVTAPAQTVMVTAAAQTVTVTAPTQTVTTPPVTTTTQVFTLPVVKRVVKIRRVKVPCHAQR